MAHHSISQLQKQQPVTLNAKEAWHTLNEIRTVDFRWLRNLESKQWSNCGNLEKLWSSYTCLAYALQAIKWYTSVIQCIMVFNKQLYQKGLKSRPSLKALKVLKGRRIGCSLCDRSPYKRSIRFSVSPHSLFLYRNKSPEKSLSRYVNKTWSTRWLWLNIFQGNEDRKTRVSIYKQKKVW